MNRQENDASYPSPYRQGRLPPVHRSTTAVGSSRNDYDVRSMLSSRALPSKDLKEPINRWDRRPVPDNYGRRNSQILHHTQGVHQNNRFNRPSSPMRQQYSYTPRESDYDKPEPSVRREYSPQRRERSQDGSFKGFTTPFPGSEAGVNNDHIDEDVRRRSYPVEGQRPASISARYPPSTPNETRYRPYTSMNGYPPEPHRLMAENKNEMRGPPEPRYSASDAGSSISTRRRPSNFGTYGYDRTWEESSNYGGNVPGDQTEMQTKLDHSTLSPRTFQRECQRAYQEARTQRLRNVEEGLYGKCTWATYDSKYC